MRIKFIPLEKSKDNSTEILRNKIVEEIAKSIELNEYIDPVTGEEFTTPEAAKRYAGMFGGEVVQDLGDEFGTTQFTKGGEGGGEGQILRGPGKKITAIRPGRGARNRLPVRVIEDPKNQVIRRLLARRAARRRRSGSTGGTRRAARRAARPRPA